LSDEIRTEQERRITELEALVSGMAVEIGRLNGLVAQAERQMSMVIVTLGNLVTRLKREDA
jgi:uncharacterized coiled-coil protein SlyX